MSTYIQETASRSTFALPSEGSIYFPANLPDETTGGTFSSHYSPFYRESGLFGNAWGVVRQINNQAITEYASDLLIRIEEMLTALRGRRFELNHLAPIHAYLVDDGSVLFEWTFSEYRVGFSIEPNLSDSGWYLVSTKKLGEISASGYLEGIEKRNLISWLLDFILANS